MSVKRFVTDYSFVTKEGISIGISSEAPLAARLEGVGQHVVYKEGVETKELSTRLLRLSYTDGLPAFINDTLNQDTDGTPLPRNKAIECLRDILSGHRAIEYFRVDYEDGGTEQYYVEDVLMR